LTKGLHDRPEFGEFADGRDEALCGVHESRRRMQVSSGLDPKGRHADGAFQGIPGNGLDSENGRFLGAVIRRERLFFSPVGP
jgi:hypothetical protein